MPQTPFFTRFLAFTACRGLAFCLSIALLHEAAPQQSPTSEYDLKSAYILNFIKFTDWPGNSAFVKNDRIVIGIVGSDPFGKSTKTIEGVVARDRVIEVVRFPNVKSIGACDVLFVPASEFESLDSILDAIKGKSILTIGEHDGFVKKGGIINLYIEEKRVRFEINTDNAAAAGFKIRSQVMALAKVVRNPEAPRAESRPASRPASGPASRPASVPASRPAAESQGVKK